MKFLTIAIATIAAFAVAAKADAPIASDVVLHDGPEDDSSTGLPDPDAMTKTGVAENVDGGGGTTGSISTDFEAVPRLRKTHQLINTLAVQHEAMEAEVEAMEAKMKAEMESLMDAEIEAVKVNGKEGNFISDKRTYNLSCRDQCIFFICTGRVCGGDYMNMNRHITYMPCCFQDMKEACQYCRQRCRQRLFAPCTKKCRK